MAAQQHTIVERQIKDWLVRTKLGRVSVDVEAPERVITLSGQYGAMGDTVGQELARLTGFTLFHRSIIQLVAERAGTYPSVVEAAETVPQTYMEEVFSRLITRARLEHGEYARHLAEVLGVIGSRGGAIVLGRGANVLLGPERAFRVRLIAPKHVRVRRVAQELKLTLAEAEQSLVAEDRRRETWIRSMVGQDICDPHLYDLVINTEVITPEQAARIVEMAAEL